MADPLNPSSNSCYIQKMNIAMYTPLGISSLQVMKTEFVPKLVATVAMCCLVTVVLTAADNLLTVKTLSAVGYFESLVSLSDGH